jgi:three-Cys-motif partner protein
VISNSTFEKWEYKEHTRVKHELLKKYLWAWIIILGKIHRKIVFFDGFAGRGEYLPDGELGSPIIALQVANNLLEKCNNMQRPPYFDEFVCIAVEKNLENFNNLEEVIEREKSKLRFGHKLKVITVNDEFANVVEQLLEQVGQRLAPSFFFIDPFGFSGIPFTIVKNILSLQRTEIFFTFMTRDISRFLEMPHIENTLDMFFPNPQWRQICIIRDWQKRDIMLKDYYIKCLLEEANTKYPWAFRVCMDDKYQTLYYLIHATNHFDGLKIMKDIMHRQSASPYFAYLGPKESEYKNQMMLFEEDMQSLKNYLLSEVLTESKIYRNILEHTYLYTRFVEHELKEALIELENENKIKILGKGPKGGIHENTECRPL